MKKILYSIFAISTMLFATSCEQGTNGNRGTTTEVVGANDDENVDPEHIRDYGDIPGDEDERYQSGADEMAAAVATDLKLDDQTKTRVQQVYYNRSKKLGDLRHGSNSSTASGSNPNDGPIDPNTIDTLRGETNAGLNSGNASNLGTANADMNNGGTPSSNSTASNTDGLNANTKVPATDMEAASQRINDEAERQLQTILTPEQWNVYQQHHARYDEMRDKIDIAGTDPTRRMNE